MHYLIDGYNLLFQVFPHTQKLIKKQSLLLQKLQKILAHFPKNVTVVLDSFETNGSSHPSSTQIGSIEVIYSPSNLTADEYIIEYLQTHSPEKEIVVTTDRELAEKSRHLGAKTLSVEAFLQQIQTKNRKKQADKKLYQDTKENIQRLLIIFERRLEDE